LSIIRLTCVEIALKGKTLLPFKVPKCYVGDDTSAKGRDYQEDMQAAQGWSSMRRSP
jgi:hypothetical protein